MANSALINELLKQFAENPRRVFARLANEYRKQGELESAIEICRQHVPLQPTYISGYIVLGQALYESGQFDEARSTFETALELDPENLIALRQLGDIARAHGDFESARGWYDRLLEVDPQNEEAVAQLSAMAASVTEETAPQDAHPDLVSWSDINPEREEIAPVFEDAPEIDHVPTLDTTPALDPTPTVDPAPVMDAIPAIELVAAIDAVPESESVSEVEHASEIDAVPELEPVSALEPEQPLQAQPAMEAAPAPEPEPELEPLPAIDPLPEIEPVPTLSHFEMLVGPSAHAEMEQADSPSELAEPDQMTSEPVEPDPAPSVHVTPPFAELVEEPPAPTFATVTMAELYERQGFPERALTIYRQLAAQRPNDERMREHVARLERAATPPGGAEPVRTGRTARELFGALAHRRPPRNGSGHAHVARRTPLYADVPGGLAALFSDGAVSPHDDQAAVVLAGAYTPGTPGGAGEPAKPASDELSLDRVFGGREEGRSGRTGTALSFDEFFARDDGAAASAGEQDVAPDTGEGGNGDDDLALFHDWLEGLKRS